VERLDDLDPKTQWDALQKLYFVAPKDLEFARKKLHGLAIGDSQIAGQANALLAEKFPKQ